VSESNICDREIVVVKMGGSVLTGVKAFRRVALFLKQRSELVPEERLVVVVSAQKLATDAMERRARRIVRAPALRALDLLWSTGELRSVALLALYLQQAGVSSLGLNVHETGLQFCAEHPGCPPRLTLTNRCLRTAVAEYPIVVVPGFLATRADGTIVSLGRGGSDLSAVLVAIGLRAARCELVKDVPGYFEDDPHKNARARHLSSLSFEESLEMAHRGCELVQMRALLAAGEAGLPLLVRSLDDRDPVTVIASGTKNGSREVQYEVVAAETRSGRQEIGPAASEKSKG
jgi:aspartate kinase